MQPWVSVCFAYRQAWQVVDFWRQRGMTALHIAASVENIEVDQYLLWRRAPPPRPAAPASHRARVSHQGSGVRRVFGDLVYPPTGGRATSLVGCFGQGCRAGPPRIARERWPEASEAW